MFVKNINKVIKNRMDRKKECLGSEQLDMNRRYNRCRCKKGNTWNKQCINKQNTDQIESETKPFASMKKKL